MSAPEQTYTLAEARRELTRRDCANDGHRPDDAVMTFGDLVPESMHCRCGAYRWLPEQMQRIERPERIGE